jgi:DNA-binding response OmpR family regulator
MATNVVLIDGSGISLAKQARAAGVKILMITGSPDRIVEFDGSGQSYLSKPFAPEAFLQRIQEIYFPQTEMRQPEWSRRLVRDRSR